MQVFNFDPAKYRASYQAHGYAHIPGGLTREFLDYALQFTEREVARQTAMPEWEFKGKKQQFLFEFPEESDFPAKIKAQVAAVAGLHPETMTLCERHVKVYDAKAPAHPPPHKDRVASQVAVGLPLVVPDNSHIILYPNDYLEINPFNSTALWRTSLDDEALPERVLANIEPLRLDVRPGDVIMFRGSSIYHERVNPANTALLYLKFNDMGMDPVGEDPETVLKRQVTLALLRELDDRQLLDVRLSRHPRLDRISRHYCGPYFTEVIQASVWANKEFTISELELSLLRQLSPQLVGQLTVRDVFTRLGLPESVSEEVYEKHVGMVRRLAQLEAVDLHR